MDPPPEAVRDFVGEARVCRIATVRPSGEPHVIPVCPVFDGEATVYVDIGRKYASTEGIKANGRVVVLIDYYDDNWALLKGVLLRCQAEPVEGEERDRAWDLIREKFLRTRLSAGSHG
jgi:nitroimidazol reductase NimA-like FMN-containing flavoprotein (pyridoxamine 5'-phosphate oxidase superfamily)